MDWIAGQYKMRMPSDYIKPASCHDQYYAAPISSSPSISRNWFAPQQEVFHGSGNIADIYKEDCMGSFNYDYVDKILTGFRNCSDFPKLLPPDSLTCKGNCMPNCTEVVDFADSCRMGNISGCSTTRTHWASHKYDNCAFDQPYVKPNGEKATTWEECRLQGAEGFSYNIYQCQDKSGHLGVCANNCKGVNPNSIIIGGLAPIAIAGLAGQGFVAPAALIGAGGLGAGAIGVGAMMMGEGGPSLGGQCPNTRPCRVRETPAGTILTTVAFAGSRSWKS